MIDFHYDYNWKYPFHSLKLFIGDFCRDMKYFFQRGSRGYSDRDIWSFDYYLSKVICNGLKKLKKDCHGYPEELKTPEKWDKVLQVMIEGFEAAKELVSSDYLDECITGYEDKEMKQTDGSTFIMEDWPIIDMKKVMEKEKIRQDKADKALKLFAKWYFALWD